MSDSGLLWDLDALREPPTDPKDNAEYRVMLYNASLGRPEVQMDFLRLCSLDLLWCFDSYFWTFDPRATYPDQPFVLYPYQREYLLNLEKHYQDRKDLLVEKSRDVGITWLTLCWLLWHWRFEQGFQAIVGSRLEDLIDEHGQLGTHFERLRWELRHLPEWWLPHGFVEEKHAPYMRLTNPETEGAIVGEAVTEHFSRQGRFKVSVLDEFAFCEHAEGAWQATADSSPVRVAISSSNGLGNKFAQLRRSGVIDVLSMHWSRHPEKARGLYCEQHGKPAPISCAWPACTLRSSWYDAECSRRERLEIAQELDIDYLGGGNPYFDLQALERQVPEEPLTYGFLVEVDLGVEFRAHAEGIWHIWELPPPKLLNMPYPMVLSVIGADVAEGIGADYSVAVVRDAKDRGLKAALRTHLDTDEFAHELIKVGRFYHNARILCERNGPGFAVNADLVKAYGNVYYEQAVDKIGAPVTKRFGWNTTARTKELMLTQLREEIRSGAVALRDKRLIEECKTFVTDEDGKVHADTGYHDDFIVAMAIAGVGIQLMGAQRQPRRPRPAMQLETSNLAG